MTEGSDGPKKSGSVAWLKFGIFVVLVGGMAAWAHGSGILSDLDYDHVQSEFDRLGPWGPIGFVILYAALIVLTMPGTVVTVLGAAIFPLFQTLLYVLVGAMLGATISFGIARLLGRDAIENFLSAAGGPIAGRLRDWTERVERNGFIAVAYLRLAYVPFSILNYAAPLTGVSFRDFFLGTVVGIVPGTFVFVFMGNTLRAVWETGEWSGLYTWKTPVAIALFLASLVLPVAVKKLSATTQQGDGNG